MKNKIVEASEKEAEELKKFLFKEYTEWLIAYQKNDQLIVKNICLEQMRIVRDKYKNFGFNIQDLKDVTPSIVNVGWNIL